MVQKKKGPTIELQELKKVLKEAVEEGVFPAAAAGIISGSGKKKREWITCWGNASLFPEKRKLQKNNFFDLASLTKPLATTMAVLCLLQQKKIELEENLSSLLEKKITGEKKKITARNLLGHSSGLPSYRPYFTLLQNKEKKEKKKTVEKIILQEQLEYEPGSRSVYSDLGFMLLGIIIEIKSKQSMEEYVVERVLKPLALEKSIFFQPLPAAWKKNKKTDFAATENCSWRNKVICGEVHDENCYALDGVAGHSGLFGNITGVTKYAGLILDMWKGVVKHPHIEREDLTHFLARQGDVPGSDWALGFDTPAGKGSSSGSFFSAKSVGHLGFTGTSFWIDPEKDVAVVLLSNRVHPTRENGRIKQFRPLFHDRIMKQFLL